MRLRLRLGRGQYIRAWRRSGTAARHEVDRRGTRPHYTAQPPRSEIGHAAERIDDRRPHISEQGAQIDGDRIDGQIAGAEVGFQPVCTILDQIVRRAIFDNACGRVRLVQRHIRHLASCPPAAAPIQAHPAGREYPSRGQSARRAEYPAPRHRQGRAARPPTRPAQQACDQRESRPTSRPSLIEEIAQRTQRVQRTQSMGAGSYAYIPGSLRDLGTGARDRTRPWFVWSANPDAGRDE